MPGASYYNRAYNPRQWKAPTIISNAIGQGEVLATPIQLANFTASIANRGYYYTPHFVKKIENDTLQKQFVKKITSIAPEHFEVSLTGWRKSLSVELHVLPELEALKCAVNRNSRKFYSN